MNPDGTRPTGRGVDMRQLRALIAAGIRLDMRSARRRGRTRFGMPPMISMLLTYIIIGSFLAVSLWKTGDPFTFALLTLSAAMFMTAVTVIMEYSSVVVNPDDHDILSHRPVSSRTYFWAKIANLFFYVSSTALSLSLPASIAMIVCRVTPALSANCCCVISPWSNRSLLTRLLKRESLIDLLLGKLDQNGR